MVHRRSVEDETLIFGVHGALLGNAMTWWDHSTGSIWSQPIGAAIAGPRKGQKLQLESSQFTTWGAWVEANPDTLALDVPAGPSSFDLQTLLIVVDFEAEARGYPVADLRITGVVNDTIAGIDIAVVSDPTNPDRWMVFSRELESGVVNLEVDGSWLRDTVTGSRFDPVNGVAREGPLTGQSLAPLPALTSFPDDFDSFWPDSDVWSP